MQTAARSDGMSTCMWHRSSLHDRHQLLSRGSGEHMQADDARARPHIDDADDSDNNTGNVGCTWQLRKTRDGVTYVPSSASNTTYAGSGSTTSDVSTLTVFESLSYLRHYRDIFANTRGRCALTMAATCRWFAATRTWARHPTVTFAERMGSKASEPARAVSAT